MSDNYYVFVVHVNEQFLVRWGGRGGGGDEMGSCGHQINKQSRRNISKIKNAQNYLSLCHHLQHQYFLRLVAVALGFSQFFADDCKIG